MIFGRVDSKGQAQLLRASIPAMMLGLSRSLRQISDVLVALALEGLGLWEMNGRKMALAVS